MTFKSINKDGKRSLVLFLFLNILLANYINNELLKLDNFDKYVNSEMNILRDQIVSIIEEKRENSLLRTNTFREEFLKLQKQ
jgi:hypothetical protein